MNYGYGGQGGYAPMLMGGGYNNCCCSFPMLIILILIVLQFSRCNKKSYCCDESY